MAVGSLIVRVGADVQPLNRGLNDGTKSLRRFADQASATGRTLTTSLTLPIAAVGAAMFKMAADAGEAADKMTAVFGDATEDMNEWVSELRETLPATTAEIQGFASGVQDLLVPLGLTADSAQDLTKQVVELAGDLASFNNLPVAEVLANIQSGLVGQYEPMLKYGVAINAAIVNARALEMGLIRQGEALTPLARAQASFALIMENTSAAHGNAADTAESAANQMKFFWVETKEAAAILGKSLLPVLTPIVARLTDFARGLQDLDPLVVRLGMAFFGITAAAGPLLLVIGSVTRAVIALKAAAALGGLATMLTPAGAILGGLALLAGAFALISQRGKEAKNSMQDFKASIAGMDAKATGAALDQARAARDAANRRVQALQVDLSGRGGRTANKDRIEQQFQSARNEAIRLSGVVEQLENRLATLQTASTPQSGSILEPATAKSAADRLKALRDEIDYFVGRGAELRIEGNFQAPIAETVEFMDIGTQRLDAEFAKVEAIAERFGMALEDVIAQVQDPELRSRLEGRLPDKDGGILSDVTGAFKSMLPALGPMAAIMPIVSGAFDAIRPVLDALTEPLRTVGTLIGQTLAPVLQLFAPALRLVAVAFSYVVEAIGWFVEALGKFIDRIVPDWISKAGKGLAEFGQEMQDNARAARRNTDATDGATDAVNRLAASLTNVPDIFDYAARRRQAALTGAAPPATGGGDGTGDGGGGGGGGGGRPNTDLQPTIVVNVSGESIGTEGAAKRTLLKVFRDPEVQYALQRATA